MESLELHSTGAAFNLRAWAAALISCWTSRFILFQCSGLSQRASVCFTYCICFRSFLPRRVSGPFRCHRVRSSGGQLYYYFVQLPRFSVNMLQESFFDRWVHMQFVQPATRAGPKLTIVWNTTTWRCEHPCRSVTISYASQGTERVCFYILLRWHCCRAVSY